MLFRKAETFKRSVKNTGESPFYLDFFHFFKHSICNIEKLFKKKLKNYLKKTFDYGNFRHRV